MKTAEEQRKREAREQRTAKEAEREELRRQRDPNEPFTGMLGSKSKPDLQDIARTLGLAINGQKKTLLARINVHFDEHPHLRENFRFKGLFNRSRQRPAVQTNENQAPSKSVPPPAFVTTPAFSAPLATNIVNSIPSTSMPHFVPFSLLPLSGNRSDS